jgi:hypothetical protein
VGGFGSGNTFSRSSRSTCEATLHLDIRKLGRGGALDKWCRGSITWPTGADIRFETMSDRLRLTYLWRRLDSVPLAIDEWISLTTTPQRLGGARNWFVCPGCHRRCAILYCRGYFRCRECADLAYESQREGPRWRALSRAQKERLRLGGSANLTEPLPAKPKGMHWRTYARRMERLVVLEDRVNRQLAGLAAQLSAWRARRTPG